MARPDKPIKLSKNGQRQVLDAVYRGGTLFLDEKCENVVKDNPPEFWGDEEKRAFDLITGTQSAIEDQLRMLFEGVPAPDGSGNRPSWLLQHAATAREQNADLAAAYQSKECEASAAARDALLARMQTDFNDLLTVVRDGTPHPAERIVGVNFIFSLLTEHEANYPLDVFPEDGTDAGCAVARLVRAITQRIRTAIGERTATVPAGRHGRAIEELAIAIEETFASPSGLSAASKDALRVALANVKETSHPKPRVGWRTTLHGIALAPCRFCGAKAEWINHQVPSIFQIRCSTIGWGRKCRMAPQTPPVESAAEAAEIWNEEPKVIFSE